MNKRLTAPHPTPYQALKAYEHIEDLIDSLMLLQTSPEWLPIWQAMGDVNLGDAIVCLGIVKDKLESLQEATEYDD